MNNFSIIGKCKNINKIDSNNFIMNIITSSTKNKEILIPIRILKSTYLNKIKENDLIGVHGTIDVQDSNILFFATKIIWLKSE